MKMKYKIKSFWEYLTERFSEVLNVQHHYSVFLLIDEFYLVTFDLFFKFINEQRLASFKFATVVMKTTLLTSNRGME